MHLDNLIFITLFRIAICAVFSSLLLIFFFHSQELRFSLRDPADHVQ